MKFYTVYYPDEKKQNICINVELIENGLANLTNYKIEEGNPSKEFDSMLRAEQEAKKNKVGLHSTKVPPLCTYSDLIVSGKTKKKEFVNFLTGLQNMNCVIDFCFSATKLKLRIDEKQVMIPFNLLGVKSFSNDKNNSSLFQKYFKLSHDYAVDLLLQRDAICDIIQSDKVGNYFGNLIYFENNKKLNFGTTLIEKGFAVVNERSYDKGKNKYIEEMKNAEKKAMKEKVGLWADEGLAKLLKGDEDLETSNTEGKLEIVNKDIKIRITDQIDLDKFFCNFLPNKTLDKIEQVLSDYDDGVEIAENLVPPIKQGTLCAARFPEDERYYRAVIKKYNKEQNEYQVEFIDYGNIEWVKLDDLIKLDGKISSLPPQAMVCGLAYLKYSKISMRKAVKKYPNFVDFENELNAKLCYSYKKGAETKYGLVVFKEGKNDMKKTYHADLLKEGLAKLNRN
jgi:staphylococcal nuclease domain-containing protein 1